MTNDKYFEELLKKALEKNITEDEEEELLSEYIEPENAAVFPYVQKACDHKYAPA